MARLTKLALAFALLVLTSAPALAQVQATFSVNMVNGSPGVTLYTLTKMVAAGSGQVTVTNAGSATGGILGIARTGVLTENGLVSVVLAGLAYCTFDSSSVTQLDYVYAAGSNGLCHDGGAGYPNGLQAIGMIVGATPQGPFNTPTANTFQVVLFPPEIRGGSGSGVSCPGCTINDLVLWNGSALANSALSDNGTTVTSTEPIAATGLTDSALTAGRCVQTTTGGQLTVAAGLCNTVLAGSPPQISGFSTTNAPEAETVSGAITLSRTGANAYQATLPSGISCSGTWLDALSTLGVGTCSASVTAPVTPPQTATYSSSTATFNAASGSEATLTISHNVTITLSGCTAGQHLFLKLVYTGSFTPTFAVSGSDSLNYNVAGAPTFSATNATADIIGFDCQSNGSGIAYDALPPSLGYAG